MTVRNGSRRRAGDGADKLNAESIRGWIRNREGWRHSKNRLAKEFQFKSFRDSIIFVNRVATIADDTKHRPDITVTNERVRLDLKTPEAGGVTEKDIQFAERVDFATSAR